MPTHQILGIALVFAGLADAFVATVILAKRLEGKPNRELVLGSIGLTAVVLVIAGALLASGVISLPA